MNLELQEFMATYGLSKRRFARLFGVSKRTAIYWAQGEMKPPHAVMVVVRAIKAGIVTVDWVQGQIENISPIKRV